MRAVLPRRELAETGVVTSAVGFGCAGLFRLPRRAARRFVLDAAYDAGIRHFDVAPMYGLGLAEAEFASFLRQRRDDVTVTTKFGIDPTLLARGVGLYQRPVRAFLAKRPDVGEGLRVASRGPRSGPFGRLLYSSAGYHRHSAQRGLERSLRALKTDCIDVFLLHDPVGDLISGAPELAEYLDEQRRLGRIRCWGVTGQPSELSSVMESLGRAAVVQFRDDIFERPLSAGSTLGGATITYGALTRALPMLCRFLAHSPGALDIWSERFGRDLRTESSLPKILLSAALRRNRDGLVLFSTTHAERTQAAAEAAIESAALSDAEVATFGELAATIRSALPEGMRMP
jgi:D-threo-aldose 1-dehydrogenase